MSDHPAWEYFQPARLAEFALRSQWPAFCLAVLGLLFVLLLASRPDRFPSLRMLAPLAWTLPFYVWAVQASLDTYRAMDILGSCPRPPRPDLLIAAAFLSQWLALFSVSIPAGIASLVALGRGWRSSVFIVGIAAAIGAVALDMTLALAVLM